MIEILAVLGFGSVALFIAGLIAMIIQLLRKKSKRIPTIIMIAAVVILVISVVLTP